MTYSPAQISLCRSKELISLLSGQLPAESSELGLSHQPREAASLSVHPSLDSPRCFNWGQLRRVTQMRALLNCIAIYPLLSNPTSFMLTGVVSVRTANKLPLRKYLFHSQLPGNTPKESWRELGVV